eukprot:gnl/MRDRNA2_/MRDRNA2_150165_c0_seq1.p1 gnl/MRDRNA2_/MRDRNA2_150165_c0~~gnl/MRDRNA2_/MRDRNA2_150165_c0_seq1.p1  ORF type:complete len:462 (+),score=70.98 gnl/MRDRNA2_/MRDRNA2_150165_c0_seq1:63-1448(+)
MMPVFVLARLISICMLFQQGAAHAAMGSPRPRNNNPNGTVNYGIKFRKINGGVAWDDFNVHDCGSGYQTEAELTWDICNEPAKNEKNRPAYIVSQTRPSAAQQVVDCTRHNDCSAPREPISEIDDGSEFVWLTVYDGADCASSSGVTYKIRSETCTQFPVSGRTYWTGGCEGYSCMWFSQGCSIGCKECTGDTKDFFKNLCGSKKQPTIMDPKYRTFNRYGKDALGDWTASHPWRAPGSAPVLDACGVAGGFSKNNEGPGGHPPPGHHWGDKGSTLPVREKTHWKAGSTVEVSWGIAANHGGGYQYRLCPKAQPLTEECFQQMPLAFASDTQTLILGNGTALSFTGTYISEGTIPNGSTWAMNPIPACGDAIPGTYGKACDFPQFPPPPGCDETCWGNSDETIRSGGRHAVLPTIVDHLSIPATLPPGDYVLGWRWDCEQTAQIWSSCSDITITSQEYLLV